MNGKRDRSPSADESTKLCLIYRSDDEKSCVYATILDPNLQTGDAGTDEDGFNVNAQPTVRFVGLDQFLSFCVFKSTLYIIEAHNQSPAETFLSNISYPCVRGDLDLGVLLQMEQSFIAKKTVYSFDLAQFDFSSVQKSAQFDLSSTVFVKKSALVKLPDMHGGKIDPDAVVTPNGQILVFSRSINYFSDSTDMVEFELYDPDTEIWSKLPPLVHDKNAVRSLKVWGSGFLTSSVYFVSTSNGNYVIDLEENERIWKKYPPLELPIHQRRKLVIGDFYFIGVEGVCLTNNDLKSTRDWCTIVVESEVYDSQDSSFPKYIFDGDRYGTDIKRLSTLMSKMDGDGCFKFCRIRAVHHKGAGGLGSKPFFIVDVFLGKQQQVNKFIISKETCLKLSPKNLWNLGLLFNFSSSLFSVQFST